MVDIKALAIPNFFCKTSKTGAMQLVVQEALLIIGSPLYSFWLTPSTMVGVTPSSLAGAEIITFFAPAVKCAPAFSLLVNLPVDSITTSTPNFPQGNAEGSFSANTGYFWPS